MTNDDYLRTLISNFIASGKTNTRILFPAAVSNVSSSRVSTISEVSASEDSVDSSRFVLVASIMRTLMVGHLAGIYQLTFLYMYGRKGG